MSSNNEQIETILNKYSSKFLKDLKENPIRKLEFKHINFVENLLNDANTVYYNSDKVLIDDATFDIIYDYLKEIKPLSPIITNKGSKPLLGSKKIKLPYHMGSMTKGKLGSTELKNWFKKYNGPYMISDKLDGVSGLLVVTKIDGNGLQFQLFKKTRSDDDIGTDVSELLNYINFGNKEKIIKYVNKNNIKRLVIRGEMVIKLSKFKKYNSEYSISRSLIGGVTNIKKGVKCQKKTSDIDFIGYQVIEPLNLKSSDQMTFMKDNGFISVWNCLYKTKPDLMQLLLERKSVNKYDIDGLIITDNSKAYENPKTGDPAYSIAFKMPLDNQKADTVVEYVEYNISKNGVLKPRIKYKPVKIGVTIQYTTGFNAKFIKENNIGPGSKITLIRSGDVTPYILSVNSKNTVKGMEWQEPDIEYKWGKNNIDIIALNPEKYDTYTAKVLLHFFDSLDFDGIKIGTINKLIDAGYDNIKSILLLTIEDLLTIDGFQIKSAKNLVDNINKKINNSEFELEKIMNASNIFKLLGEKKLKLLRLYLESHKNKTLNNITVNEIINIDGYSEKTAKKIIDNIAKFNEWYHDLSDIIKIKKLNYNTKKKSGSIMNNEYVVFSGIRNKEWNEWIESNGGTIQNTVNKKTTILVVKDKTATTSKIQKAKELNITIMNVDEFKAKIN